VYVSTGVANRKNEPMATWSAELGPVLQTGAENTSGVAYAVLYRDGAVAKQIQSRDVNWSNVDNFLKQQDAYLTFAWAGFRNKRDQLEVVCYHKDEALSKNIERVDVVYLKPPRSAAVK
jgi:hypothetical protein